ncbi:MAG: Fic family protein [Planctomycetes bacterium]|nr:Fic family protein [Planctomycetota bacterium]
MSESRQRGHRWQPIADLPADWTRWRDSSLPGLLAVWHRRRQELPESAVREFLARLVRRWSIETGILERIYTLDESATQTLVELGFDAAHLSHGDSDLPAGQLIAILEDHRDAAEGLFAFVNHRRDLSTSYIKELHQQLLRHQEFADGVDSMGSPVQVRVRKGDWKQWPNNPGDRRSGQLIHEYCPPEQTASEMDRLLLLHQSHADVPFEIEAAWLHHRFTQIHPFQDGNGRVARALATLVCLRAGSLPLVVERGDKREYIAALEQADRGDLGALIGMFRRQQQEALLRALQLAELREAPSGLAAVLEEARKRLESTADSFRIASGARGRVESLLQIAIRRFETAARDVTAIGAQGIGARMMFANDANSTRYWQQISVAAGALGYDADPIGHRAWIVLHILWGGVGGWSEQRRCDLVVSLHPVRNTSEHVMAAVALLCEQSTMRTGDDDVRNSQLACKAPFTFTDLAEFNDEAARFTAWLESALVMGLDGWRRML